MIPHLIFNSNILKFQLIVLSDSVSVARQLGICGCSVEVVARMKKYCSLSCLLDKNKYRSGSVDHFYEYLLLFFVSDLFCVVYVIEQFLEL